MEVTEFYQETNDHFKFISKHLFQTFSSKHQYILTCTDCGKAPLLMMTFMGLIQGVRLDFEWTGTLMIWIDK